MEYVWMLLSATDKVEKCTCGVAITTIIIRCGLIPANRSRQPTGNVWMQVSGTELVGKCTCGVAASTITTRSGRYKATQGWCGVKIQPTRARASAITTCAEIRLDITQFGATQQTSTSDGKTVTRTVSRLLRWELGVSSPSKEGEAVDGARTNITTSSATETVSVVGRSSLLWMQEVARGP